MNIVVRGQCKTVDDVVKNNTGMTLEEMDAQKEYKMYCLRKNPTGDYIKDDLAVVADILRTAAVKNIPITIVGDYDADGISATSILAITLNSMGVKPTVRLPRRMSEGFGLSEKIVDEIKEGILITVDNGIAAIDAVKKAKEKGLTVIITDHHLPNKDETCLVDDCSHETGFVDIESTVLPEADFIINPHLAGTSDFSDYCGAGIAYKLALELTNDPQLIRTLSGYAAIGTVADVVPLLYDNRQITKEGLDSLVDGKSRTTGMDALLRLTNKDRTLTSSDISYTIGPMINAPGRMDDNGAMTALTAITFNGNFTKAEELAKTLMDINKKRKQAKEDGLAEVNVNIVMNCLYGDNPLCIYEPSIPEGIVGIIAGKMAEEKKVPSFVFTNSETPGIIKGSGRTYGNTDIKEMLDYCQDLLYKYGGHKEAAGVSVELDKFEDMKERMREYMSRLPQEEIDDNIYYDLEIDARDIEKYLDRQKKFEPFGQGNPKPVYYIRNFEIINKKTMGNENEHIKPIGKCAEAIGFGMTEQYRQMGEPRRIDIVGTLSENFFNGKCTPQVEIRAMKTADPIMLKSSRTQMLERAIAEKMNERRAI